MKEQDKFILDIKRMGINGEGIGYYNKLAIFVKDAIPGEGADIEITKSLPNMAYGKINTIKRKSKYRVEPRCKYYLDCGACQTMHIDNKKMGEFKRDLVIESLRRYTDLNPHSFEIKPTLVMEEPWHYRNKSTLAVRRVNGQNMVAMIKEGTNTTFGVDTCLVQDEKINDVNSKLIKLSNKLNIASFGCANYSLRYISTRCSKATRETQVCLIVKEYNSEIKGFVKNILIEGICDSLYVNINNDLHTHELFGEKTIHVGGKEAIIEQIDRYKFNIYPTTFFQLNTSQTEVLYKEVLKACKLTHKETVLDAYCGVGTIATYLASFSKNVVGIEYSGDSVVAAKENLKLNKKKNITYYQGDVVKLLPKLINNGMVFDVMVFDPPRTGLGEDTINTIINSKVEKLVYVSCNHSTLAKDLAKLTEHYNIKYIQPVDMFPNTSHVETVTLLTHTKK